MNPNESGKPTVLFVDDEVRVLRSLQRVLGDKPFRMLTAESADEALLLLSRERVDVMISDERMPGMSGSELLAEVKNRYPEVCRIMLTGHADMEAAMKAINEGRIFRFLIKPVSPHELVSVIHKALEEREQSQKLFELSQQAGGVCSFEVTFSTDGKYRVRWSTNARSLLHLPVNAPLDSIDILYSRLHPDDLDRVRELNEACLQGRLCNNAEYRILTFNDRVRWISQTSDMAASAEGKRPRLLSVLRDITEIKWQHDQLEHQAFHDSLTGLGNRALLRDRLQKVLRGAEKGKARVALLFIDLDNFKLVNDSMGHTFGDWLLQAFAQRLASIEPAGALTVRLGGDEFAQLLLVNNSDQALDAARAIQTSMQPPFGIGDFELFITASIGISIAPKTEVAGLDLLRDADTAMYVAKSQGKGSFKLFDTSMHDRASERFVLVSEMHNALTRDEFFLVFQPIVELKSLTMAGLEALARWRHPERGVVMPDTFIPVAEDSGLITRLGMQVMDKVCRQAHAWRLARPESTPFVSFNVSVQQLRQVDLVSRLEAAIDELGLDPGLIKVEITETGLMDDVQLSMRVLGKLKALGVKLQIDDFGTGYSSLRYLQRIPADSLKVDKSFVMGMEHDAEKRAIVKTIIDLAHSLNLEAIAEGVETCAQLAILLELGCGYGQGYLFDKPLPPEEAIVREAYASRFSSCLATQRKKRLST
jgi:diguanylate cyclase (GGDEF)-like protein